MKDILLVVLFVCLIIIIFLWMADRKKWKQVSIKWNERDQEYFQQKESMNVHIRELELELAQTKEENIEVGKKVHKLEEQQIETARIVSDSQETVRKTYTKIHLYSQLLQEQCSTDTAQKYCRIILQECEKVF